MSKDLFISLMNSHFPDCTTISDALIKLYKVTGCDVPTEQMASDFCDALYNFATIDSFICGNKQSMTFEGVLQAIVDESTDCSAAVRHAMGSYCKKYLSRLNSSFKPSSVTNIGMLRLYHDALLFVASIHNRSVDTFRNALLDSDTVDYGFGALPSSLAGNVLTDTNIWGYSWRVRLEGADGNGYYYSDDEVYRDFINWVNIVLGTNPKSKVDEPKEDGEDKPVQASIEYSNIAIGYLSQTYKMLSAYEKIYDEYSRTRNKEFWVDLTNPEIFKYKTLVKCPASTTELRYEPFILFDDIASDSLKDAMQGCEMKSIKEASSVKRVSITDSKTLALYCMVYMLSVYTSIAFEITKYIRESFKQNSIFANVSLKLCLITLQNSNSGFSPVRTYVQANGFPVVRWDNLVPTSAKPIFDKLFLNVKIEDFGKDTLSLLDIFSRLLFRKGWGDIVK